MTEERLADKLAMHRWLRDITRRRNETGSLERRTSDGWTTHCDAVDAFDAEIDRLRAENERLTDALTWLYELNAEGVYSLPDEHYGAITNAAVALGSHEPKPKRRSVCPVGYAHCACFADGSPCCKCDALNPEATS